MPSRYADTPTSEMEKVKLALEQAMKAQKGSRGRVLLFL
jgi:hypothetical protein